MTLKPAEIAYGQQKNREYIYLECKEWYRIVFGRKPRDGNDDDEAFIDKAYEIKCALSNITPW